MKETNEELLKKVIEIEKVKSKEDAYKYMIARYIYSSKSKKKSKNMQIVMISASSIEKYFNIELNNDYMQKLIENFLRTVCIHEIDIYDYSSSIINYYE